MIYMKFFSLFAAIAVTESTSIWNRGFGADVFVARGPTFGAEFDPMSSRTTVWAGTAGGRFSLSGGISWQEPNVDTTTTGPAIVGLSPQSAFIATHKIVTFMPSKGKMVVGPFDASPACNGNRMSFVSQAANATQWLLPLIFNASDVTNEAVSFEISFRGNTFSVPNRVARPFALRLQRQLLRYQERNQTYTLAQARAEMPTVHLKMGDFDLPLIPKEYVMQDLIASEIFTTFYDSHTRNPVLPNSLMKRVIVQFDALNHRVGICAPT